MKSQCMIFATALCVAGSPWPAMAQASAPAVATSPTPPPRVKPPPRLLTPDEKRDSATTPGDVRPERPVSPQINIPFGKKAPEPAPLPSSPGRRAPKPSADGINDAAARCEAQPSAPARAECREKLSRDAKSR